MTAEPMTKEDMTALLMLIYEEAVQDNEPYGRSDTLALHRIRALLDIPRHGVKGYNPYEGMNKSTMETLSEMVKRIK